MPKYIYSNAAVSDQTNLVSGIPLRQRSSKIEANTASKNAETLYKKTGSKKYKKDSQAFKKASKNMNKSTPTPKLLEEYNASLLVNPEEALYNHVAYNLRNEGYVFLPNVGWVNPNDNGKITQAKERGFFGRLKDSLYDWANSNSNSEFMQDLKNDTRHHLWSWDRGQTILQGLGKTFGTAATIASYKLLPTSIEKLQLVGSKIINPLLKYTTPSTYVDAAYNIGKGNKLVSPLLKSTYSTPLGMTSETLSGAIADTGLASKFLYDASNALYNNPDLANSIGLGLAAVPIFPIIKKGELALQLANEAKTPIEELLYGIKGVKGVSFPANAGSSGVKIPIINYKGQKVSPLKIPEVAKMIEESGLTLPQWVSKILSAGNVDYGYDRLKLASSLKLDLNGLKLELKYPELSRMIENDPIMKLAYEMVSRGESPVQFNNENPLVDNVNFGDVLTATYQHLKNPNLSGSKWAVGYAGARPVDVNPTGNTGSYHSADKRFGAGISLTDSKDAATFSYGKYDYNGIRQRIESDVTLDSTVKNKLLAKVDALEKAEKGKIQSGKTGNMEGRFGNKTIEDFKKVQDGYSAENYQLDATDINEYLGNLNNGRRGGRFVFITPQERLVLNASNNDSNFWVFDLPLNEKTKVTINLPNYQSGKVVPKYKFQNDRYGNFDNSGSFENSHIGELEKTILGDSKTEGWIQKPDLLQEIWRDLIGVPLKDRFYLRIEGPNPLPNMTTFNIPQAWPSVFKNGAKLIRKPNNYDKH